MEHPLGFLRITRYATISFIASAILLSIVAVTLPTQAQTQSVTEAAIANYNSAQANNALSDEEKIKVAIDAYFTLRYESRKLLQVQDFSVLLEDNTLDWVQKEIDKQDIEIYIATLYNSPYVSYRYTLDYGSVKIDKETAVVQLRESNEVVIKLSSEASKMANLLHIFTLHNQDGAWVIYKDEYQDELSQGLAFQTKEELLQQVDENYRKSKQPNSISANSPLVTINARPLALVAYPYNGTSAKNYAAAHWSNYNTAYYKTEPGNDCTNFVSQAMYAGEGKTPPDTSGMGSGNYNNQWYYVFNNPPGTQNGSGSFPWVNVGGQYSFITGNTGNKIGPYGSSTASFCNARVGDVIQLQSGSSWFHEGIIVGKDSPCYGPQSLYAAAHTTDRYWYNVYNWTMYGIRFIRINGWYGN